MIIKILTILLLLCILSYLVTNKRAFSVLKDTLYGCGIYLYRIYFTGNIFSVIIYGIIQLSQLILVVFFLMGIILI